MRVKPIRNKLAYGLAIIGLCLILFPFMREWHYEWKQEKLLAELEQAIQVTELKDSEVQLVKRNESLTQLFMQSEDPEVEQLGVSSDAEKPIVDKEEIPPLGYIEINKIKLKLPILEGATNENMKFAAAHLTETTPLGEIGNAAIAAHRARTKGRLFNRLNELKNGDEIIVKLNDKELVYIVAKVLRVKPTDISVLGRNKKDAILTLITCDPVVDPTHRLIVQAKLSI
jgi:sortase A